MTLIFWSLAPDAPEAPRPSLSATKDPNSPLPAPPGSAAALPEEAEVVVEQDFDLYADTEPLEYVTVKTENSHPGILNKYVFLYLFSLFIRLNLL